MIDLKNIPKHWEVKKLGEVCDKVSLNGLKLNQKKFLLSGEFPVVDQGQDLIGGYYNDKNLVVPKKPPYIIFGDHTRVKKYIDFSFIAGGDGIKVLQPHLYIDTKYFFYFIHIVEIPNKGYARHFQYLENSNIYYPPISEQKQIVAKIEALFTELENGKQKLLLAKQQLETYKQSLLKAAFEGRLSNKNVKDGELPKGWEWAKLKDMGIWKGGGTPSKQNKKFWEAGTNLWVSSKDMKSNIIIDTIDKITNDAIKNSSAKRIEKGAVLFVMRSGILRRTFPVAIAGKDLTVNQDLQTLTPNKNVLSEFIFWFIHSQNNEIRRVCSKDGTTVESIESTLLKNYPIPYPSKEEQKTVVSEIENVLSKSTKSVEMINGVLQNIETLKQSILQQAFEGKLINTKTASKIVKAKQAKVVSIATEIFKPKSEYFYQCQILATVIRASNKKNIQHGEMTLAKMAYLIDKVFKIPTYYQYKQWHLGPYAPAMKKAINKKEFFNTKGNHVTIADEQKLFKSENPNIELTENAVDELSAIFIKYDANIRSHKIELLATVCKVVEDIKTTSLTAVLKAMQNWTIDITKTKDKFKNKAEKFTEEETKKTLAFLVSKGWDKKLIEN
jgi:type I restriction enzyme, S subunit